MANRQLHSSQGVRRGMPADTAAAAARAPLAGDNSFMRRSLLGIRVSAIIETLLFLAAILAIDHFYFAKDRFWNVEPHPFWLIVVLVSAQYGTNEGVFAAAACSVALLSGPLPEQSIDTDFYTYVLHIGVRPLLWLTSAIVLGELRNRYGRRQVELEQQLTEATEREHGIAQAYQELKAAHEKLEINVASELRTVVSIYRAAKTLQNLSVNEVMTNAVNLVSTVLGPEKFSLYTIEGGALTQALKRGWTEEDNYETTLWPDHPLFQTVVAGQRYVSAADPVDERVLGGQGMLAGPLFQGEGGEVVGMLKVERLRFADLNLTTVENFKVVCDLLSTALGNARRYDNAAAQSILSTDSMLLSDAFYARQAAFLAALGKRIGFPISIMRVNIENMEEIGDLQRDSLPGLVREATEQVLRTTDLAFEFKSGQWQYIVVLPNTPMTQTDVVVEKFRDALTRKLEPSTARLLIECEPLVAPREGSGIAESLPSMEEYARQTQFLLAVSRRAGTALSLVRLAVTVNVQLPPSLRLKLPGAVLAAVRETITESEQAFNLERSGLVIAVLLPGVEAREAEERAQALRTVILRKLGGAGGQVSVHAQAEVLALPQQAALPAPAHDEAPDEAHDEAGDEAPALAEMAAR